MDKVKEFKAKEMDTVEDVTAVEVTKVSELHLAKIKEIQAKEAANKELAPDVCVLEFDLIRLEEFVVTKREEYKKAKEALHKGYTDLADMNEALGKELEETYGKIRFTNIETGEYTTN